MKNISDNINHGDNKHRIFEMLPKKHQIDTKENVSNNFGID